MAGSNMSSAPQGTQPDNTGNFRNTARADRFVVENISDYDLDENENPLFCEKWYDYPGADSIWEPPAHIDYNTVVLYCRRHGKLIPITSLWQTGLGLDN